MIMRNTKGRTQNTVKELRVVKKYNKVLVGLIIILMITLIVILADLKGWANQYEELVEQYQVLYEELSGGEVQ